MRFASAIINRVLIWYYQIEIGSGARLNGRCRIYAPKKRIKIGKNFVANSNPYAIPIGYSNNCTFWILEDGELIIGDDCGFSNTTICCMNKIVIGNHVLLGGGVKLYDTDFHSLNYEKRRNISNDNDRRSKPIVIGDDVFIGAGSFVLKGVTIGERSVIGAGSVVTSDIPEGELWAGNPARFIRNL